MKYKIYFCAFLIMAIIFSLIPPVAFATEGEAVNAEIMTVYGGADGIISMTFDDGYYATALVLDELFEKYDLKGSIMMIGETAVKNAGKFESLFDAGRLEPQSHSMSHARLTDTDVPLDKQEEIFEYEIAQSKPYIGSLFPEYDILTFAIPYGSMCDSAVDYAAEHFYAIRTTKNGFQTLDPASSAEAGGWYAMYSPVTYRSDFDYADDLETVQWEWLKSCIDNAAGGWYIPITHRVGDVEDADLSYKMADKMFAYIASLRDEGKVWVTTYSEATKYVRERQNSTVRAYSVDGVIYTEVTMSDTTDDGLPLDPAVFNAPLTVKVEVPAEYGSVYYTVDEKEYISKAFSDGSKNYVYVNVAPNAGPVELRISSTHSFAEWNKYDDELHKRNCIDCGLADYGDHVWDEGEIVKAPTHTKTGTKECTCISCGEKAEFKVKKTDDHTYDQKVESMNFKADAPTCTSGETYYYSCVCGDRGTETYEVGEPIPHVFGEWTVLEAATQTADGRSVRKCNCGESEYETIPAIGEGKNTAGPLFIGLTVGGAALLLASGIAVTLVILKRKRS